MIHRNFYAAVVAVVFTLASQFAAAAGANTEQVIKSYMQAWNDHKPDQAASYFADNGEFLDASVGTPQVGRQAANDNVIKVFIQAVPDLKWKMLGEPIVNGDNIAFEWEFTGNNTGAWGPETPATNKPLAFKGVSFIRLSDGKIASQHDYYDALGFNKQLGW